MISFLLSEFAKVQEERAKKKEEQKRKKKELAERRKKELDSFDTPPTYQYANLFVTNDEISGSKGEEAEGTTLERKPWTQSDEMELVRLTNKYPGGFPNRWSKIAEAMGRPVADVTAKAAEIARELSSRTLVNRKFYPFYALYSSPYCFSRLVTQRTSNSHFTIFFCSNLIFSIDA